MRTVGGRLAIYTRKTSANAEPASPLPKRLLGRIIGSIAGDGSSDPSTMHWAINLTFPDNAVWTLEGMRHTSGRLALYVSKTKTEANHPQPMIKVRFGHKPITKTMVDQLVEREEFQSLGRYDLRSNSCQHLALRILRGIGVRQLTYVELVFTPLQSRLQRFVARFLGNFDPAVMHWAVCLTFVDNAVWHLEGLRTVSGRLALYVRKSNTQAEPPTEAIKISFGHHPITKGMVDALLDRQEFQRLGRYHLSTNSCQHLAVRILRGLGVRCPRRIGTAHKLFRTAKSRAAFSAAYASGFASASADAGKLNAPATSRRTFAAPLLRCFLPFTCL
ncbi:hypothetical protein HPB52_019039 [Rhipicephalus sanguineus]|uniref:PPPDE domain-containing protein n=1 Tax=Rhipicephalus sanguineus TaxID=34632 RepID=A0A9D4ST91_RHISA|nr:hypothetical protein HPB52_019039 [Rhipicephalus sanguineus]